MSGVALAMAGFVSALHPSAATLENARARGAARPEIPLPVTMPGKLIPAFEPTRKLWMEPRPG